MSLRIKNNMFRSPKEEESKEEGRSVFNRISERLKNLTRGNWPLILGILLGAFTLYLTVALSYYVIRLWDCSLSEGGTPTGIKGLGLSRFLFHDGFGFASFALCFILLVWSLKLMNVAGVKLFSWTVWGLFIGLWLSVFFGYFFRAYYEQGCLWYGGVIGHQMVLLLEKQVGSLGTSLIVITSLFLALILAMPKLGRGLTEFLGKKRVKTASAQKVNPPTTSQQDSHSAGTSLVVDDVSEGSHDEDSSSDTPEVKNEEGEEDALQGGFTIRSQASMTEKEEQKEEEEVGFAVHERLEEERVTEIQRSPTELEDYDPKLDLSDFRFPSLELLRDHEQGNVKVSEEELQENKVKIVETLRHYGIEIKDITATIGPTVTLYEIIPAPGVRLSKIKNLEDDIALSLSALGIRIIAPIPGKGTVGIEVPNQSPEVVSMRAILSSKKFQESKFDLPMALGKTITNETFMLDLCKMPHMLVAGATGQGKSVGLNAIITSLLYKKHPAQLKFVFVDPKKVELNIYSKIENHYLAKLPDVKEPIITDVHKVIQTLNSITVEMDSRYDLLKKAHTRNLKEYNEKFIKRRLNPNNGHKYLPYIVVVVDEFADLIMTAGKEVELPIARIAQLARAVGIHMIIATQRPSANIITGIIKANFPARVAFRVSSMIDSRTILDAPGANQLIGRGDMLVSAGGNEIIRVQCAFVDTPEVENIVDFIGDQRGYPTAFMLPEYSVEEEGIEAGALNVDKIDELFDEAARVIVAHQQGSASLLQRRFSIGYNRAGRLMDQLEATGIVGGAEGSKPRQVLITDEVSLEQFLQQMREKE